MSPSGIPHAQNDDFDFVAGSAELAWAMLESMPDTAYVVFGPDLVVQACGGQPLDEHGYSSERMIGTKLGDVLDPVTAAAYLPACEDTLRGEVAKLEVTSRDGRRIYASDFSPLRNAAGEVAGGMVVMRDVTLAREAQAALQASEQDFRELADNSTDLLVRCSFDSIIEYVSPASMALLGYTPEELVGRCVHDLMHIESGEQLAKIRGRVFGDLDAPNASTVRMEGKMVHANGHFVWVEATVRPVLHPATGRPVGTQSAVRDISERRMAEEALRVSEARSRLLLENLPDSIVTRADRDLICRFMGGGAMAKTGARSEDFVGKPLKEIYESFGPRGEELLGYNHAALQGMTTTVVAQVPPDWADYEIKIMPLPGENDEIVGTMIIGTDVTEKLRRERDVERLAMVVAATGEAIISTGLNGQINAVNQRACTLFGYTEDELLRLEDSVLITPDARIIRDEARRAVFNGRAWRGEYDHVTRDGRRFPAAVTLSPVFNEDGALVGRSVLIADITERHEAQQRLLEANKRFEQTIANAPIGMALVGIDGSWLEVNRALCGIVGYEHHELMGKSFQTITHPDDLDKDLEYVQDVLDGKIDSYEMEKRYIRSDGSIVWVLLTVSLVRDADGHPLHFISQLLDISDRKSVEDTLRAAADMDPLTGVRNRRSFNEVLTASIASARRHAETSALLFLDLDGFKAVNDTLGHQVGDDVLKAVAHALVARIRATDTVARHGGDEFVVLLDRVSAAEASIVVDQLLDAVRSVQVQTADGPARIDASIGLAMLDGVTLPTAADAMAAADAAMYRRKSARG